MAHDPGLHWTASRVATTDAERIACGQLRRLAYARAGKADDSDAPMLDALDDVAWSRVLYWRARDGRVAATCRLLLPRNADDALDTDSHVPRPAWAPSARLLAEGSRIAVHPEFRGRGLLLGCGKAMNLALLRDGRRYMFACAEGQLRQFYLTVGFRRIGASFVHHGLGGVEHEILLGHLPDGLYNRARLDPRVWMTIHAPVLAAAAHEGLLLRPTPAESVLQRAVRLLTPDRTASAHPTHAA